MVRDTKEECESIPYCGHQHHRRFGFYLMVTLVDLLFERRVKTALLVSLLSQKRLFAISSAEIADVSASS